MEIFREILLGIVQGITGYLPVSSQGHVFLFCTIFGMEMTYSKFLLCMLKISGVFSIMIYFFKDIIKLVIGAFQLIQDLFSNLVIFINHRLGRDSEGYYVLDTNPFKRQALMLVYSCITTFLVAMMIHSIGDNASQMPMFIGITSIVSGVILFLAERLRRGHKSLERMNTMDAVMIGLAQGIGVIPGLSRVVLTYSMALALGYKRNQSMRYTCLLSIPTVIGYSLFSIKTMAGTAVSLSNLGNILAAMLFCGILTFLMVRVMLGIAKRGTTIGFAVYNVIAGALVVLSDIII
ncbi:MAG: undecaprenyl-diphosphate phosphatase [Lachnospiraceae bacterium]